MRLKTALIAVAMGAVCMGCQKRELKQPGTGGAGVIGTPGTGGGMTGDPGTGGGVIGVSGGGGGGGSAVVPVTPCAGPTDLRMVVEQQRTRLLTSTQILNMIRALTDDAEADAVVKEAIFQVTSDFQMRFPPARYESIKSIPDSTTMFVFVFLARHVAKYVFDNFATLTGCAGAATDSCATSYLTTFAERAYRRPIEDLERSDLFARYTSARISASVENSVRQVVEAILIAPPFLYRYELGDSTRASSAPPGAPLKPYELASAISFFLTDGPPDQPLLDAARAGTLTPETVGPHVERLLLTETARAWLTKIMETLFTLNQLPGVIIDPSVAPAVEGGQIYGDMLTEAHMFVDSVLWSGALTDLLTSRATYLNTTLAKIYGVPVPPGATDTTFVRAMLPVAERSGLLTNAGFLTRAARATGVSLMTRAFFINFTMVGRDVPPPAEAIWQQESDAYRLLDMQTAQEQVAYRAARPQCADCHMHFDPYGQALDRYDIIGRLRTADERGRPIDGHTTLPPALGGVPISGAIELAQNLVRSDVFVQWMATEMLSYGLIDTHVERPGLSGDPPRAACAVNDIVRRFQSRSARTFSGLLQDVAASPSFGYRRPAAPTAP